MNPLDNTNSAPVIPAGTEKTVYGTASFQTQPQVTATVVNTGQAQVVPAVNPTNQPNAPLNNGTTFAELAAKKGFQSPDDLAKAYMNLESHNKKVEMTAADIIKAVQEPQQVVVNNPAYQVPSQVASQYVPPANNQTVNPDEAAIQIVKNIVQSEVKPLQQTVELQQLFLNNPDAKEYATGIAEVVKRNPGIKWDDAYKLAKFDAAQNQAAQKGQQEAYQTIQQKQAVVAGAPSPTQRATPDLTSIIRDRTVPFKEVDRMVRETLARMQ